MVADSAWTDLVPATTDELIFHAAASDLLVDLRARASDGPRPMLVILPLTRERRAAADLPELVRALRVINPAALPVLLHDGSEDLLLPACFRAGLFDAIPLGDDAAWEDLLQRVGARLAVFDEADRLEAAQQETTERLLEHRQRLQVELVRAGDDLARSHLRLEEANQALTEHMDQLSLLYTIVRELSTTPNWDSTLESLLGTMADFVGAQGAALVLRPAPDAPFAPRQTFHWNEEGWDRVLTRLEAERRREDGDPGEPVVITLEPEAERDDTLPVVAALSLDHMHACLGYLLLLDFQPRTATSGQLAFLRTAQIILAEEVAAAQMLDRMRELGTFNSRVLEAVDSGIWVLDDLGRTIFCNRGGRELVTGRAQAPRIITEPDTALGRGRHPDDTGSTSAFFRRDTFHLEGLPELLLDAMLRLEDQEGPALAAFKHEDPEPFYGEGRVVRADGTAVPVMVQAHLMPGRARDELWRVVVLEDLRPVKRLAQETRRADALESLVEMSAALAHEIRNPLMGLSAQAELLGDNLEDDDPRRRYIDVITGEVGRINDTITRMLQFVRPYEPELGHVDLDRLLRDSLVLARPRADDKDVRLGLGRDLPRGESATLAADGTQLKQVVLNLLFNAVDASPAGGTVSATLTRVDDLLVDDPVSGESRVRPGFRLAVTDEGPGVAPADRDRIFRPFYTTKNSGTGLGLSICRKIVKAHAGRISVDCDGNGTIFAILLPDLRDSEETAPAAQEQEMS